MAKITPRKVLTDEVIQAKTKAGNKQVRQSFRWWMAKSKAERVQQLLDTVLYLKEQQQYRYRQAAIFSRMYSNMPLFNFAGSSLNRMSMASMLPSDRPTMNVVQSCVDTKVSRITQNRPRPLFLTDNGHYKQRALAQQMNQFIAGEFYQMKAYLHGEELLRDADVLGTGCWKVYRTQDDKVGLDRVFKTNLFVDPNDSLMGRPRQLFHLDLIDRDVLMEWFPEKATMLERAEQAYPDNAGESQKTVSDQVMVAEAWRLPSSPEAKDGRHMIVCSQGELVDEEWDKDRFPFVFLHSSPPLAGFWGQGCPERIMGTQVEINKLLITMSQSINLVGVPRVLVEDSSKVVGAHINNQIGSIIKYRGTPPVFLTAECMPQEVYAQLQRLIEYAYQQEGISTLMAQGQKPAGLNSGEAQRVFENIQTDRFAALEKRYAQAYIDLAHLAIDTAVDIAKDTGKYQTVFPCKDGTKKINLPDIAKLQKDPFVLQCFDTSSLPRDPAGRMQTIVERVQAGIYTMDVGKRLLQDLDLMEEDNLENAPMNRVLRQLDSIVEDGKLEPPDPFTNIAIAEQKCVQYISLYSNLSLEEAKMEKLRTYWLQIQDLKKQAASPDPTAPQPPGPPAPGGPPPPGAPADPIAEPMPPPQSDLVPFASQ